MTTTNNTNVGTCVRSSIEVSHIKSRNMAPSTSRGREVQFTMLLLTAVLVGRADEYHLDAYLATCKVFLES